MLVWLSRIGACCLPGSRLRGLGLGGLKVAEVEEWRDRFLLGAGEYSARQEFITSYKPQQSSGVWPFFRYQ